MHRRLSECRDKFKLIRPEQLRFQKNKSTTLATFTLMKEILIKKS